MDNVLPHHNFVKGNYSFIIHLELLDSNIFPRGRLKPFYLFTMTYLCRSIILLRWVMLLEIRKELEASLLCNEMRKYVEYEWLIMKAGVGICLDYVLADAESLRNCTVGMR